MIDAQRRLSLNQATIKRADLATALRVSTAVEIEAIGLWREPVKEVGLRRASRLLSDSGLRFTSLCRGGFFTLAEGALRRAALDDNRRAIEETAELAAAGAPGSAAVLVLVAGGLPDPPGRLAEARARVGDALSELVPEAQAMGVTLAIEPLHPMYASDRSVVSTLGQALDLVRDFPAEAAGVVVDTFHIWWDPDVLAHLDRAAKQRRIATYQVCDWSTPLPADVLLARHFPGDGIIDLDVLTAAVASGGYLGDVEVEVFNADVWSLPPEEAALRTRASFRSTIAPHLH